jgi:hypothetical protein
VAGLTVQTLQELRGCRMKKILLVASICFLAMGGIVSAATIELPRTGQTACYDTFGDDMVCTGTGQDGETQYGAILPVPRFTTDYYGQTVVDNLTGLMWALDSRTPDPYDPNVAICAPDDREISTWYDPTGSPLIYDVFEYMACLNANNFLGYNDWRLPNREELRSLILDFSASGPALPAGNPFINVEAPYSYWSSTGSLVKNPVPPDLFFYGVGSLNIWSGSESGSGSFVWPVRAGQTDGNPDPAYPANLRKTGQRVSVAPGDDGDIQAGVAWPDPRFTVTYCDASGPCANPADDCDLDPSNDVVTDNLTGITWMRLPDNIHRTWDESLSYANDLGLCGYSNWRLPNINELDSMIHSGEPDIAVWLNTSPPYYFMGIESWTYWSSTTDRAFRSTAMVVDLWDGSIGNQGKAEFSYAWPVRLPGGVLTVLKTGEGLGTVTSVPPGIDCGSDCSQVYLDGTEVTLTAVEGVGSTFEGWSGACTGTGTCILTINADTQVTASFSTPESACTYSILPKTFVFPINGGTTTVAVTASEFGCPEPSVPAPAQAWAHPSITSWNGKKGAVRVIVDPSFSSVRRVSYIGIGNKIFEATQKKRSCTPGGLPPIFNPLSTTWSQAGGTGSFEISFPPGAAVDCIWTAEPSAKTTWVSTESKGTGEGVVDYSVDPNLSAEIRKGNINIHLLQKPLAVYQFKVKQLD